MTVKRNKIKKSRDYQSCSSSSCATALTSTPNFMQMVLTESRKMYFIRQDENSEGQQSQSDIHLMVA